MNILVADSSTQALNIAIKTDSFFETRTIESLSTMHSERLMIIVNELCKDAKISTKDIEFLSCTRGPGSFTGLRVAMAAFKGIAYALEKPLVSVSTLETLAMTNSFYDGAIVAAIDAKKQRYYLGAFENTKTGLVRLSEDIDGTALDLLDVLKKYPKILVTGPDAKAFSCILQEKMEDKDIYVDTVSYRAITTALIKNALQKYETSGADDIGQGPLYIRKSDAEVALEERLRKNNG